MWLITENRADIQITLFIWKILDGSMCALDLITIGHISKKKRLNNMIIMKVLESCFPHCKGCSGDCSNWFRKWSRGVKMLFQVKNDYVSTWYIFQHQGEQYQSGQRLLILLFPYIRRFARLGTICLISKTWKTPMN